jgi:hypothetical protein|tara:strand:+ start:3314 stop:3481 length:168 start_codon:yes stop_codon:yes gene_type:complete
MQHQKPQIKRGTELNGAVVDSILNNGVLLVDIETDRAGVIDFSHAEKLFSLEKPK